MSPFDLDRMKERVLELNEEMADPALWEDQDKARVKNKELSDLQGEIKEYEALVASAADIEAMIELGTELEDESLCPEIDARARKAAGTR